VSNVETFAHIALICRYGPGWFRELGTREQPGSSLVTVSGAVADPGVYEIGIGVRLRELVSACGGATSAPRAALIGGLGGTWIGPGDLAGIELCDDALAAHGASIGAGVVVLLDEDACPVAETLRIVRWLADQSARQCGPCVNGLAAISAELASVAGGHRAADPVRELERLSALVLGRGACALPDGVSALVVSAIDVFREEFAEHASAGPCEGCLQPPRLSLPVLDAGDTIAASRRARALTGERR
jgi:NADH:ubiquinone oxidoreductase subunit F (NADH-binding)